MTEGLAAALDPETGYGVYEYQTTKRMKSSEVYELVTGEEPEIGSRIMSVGKIDGKVHLVTKENSGDGVKYSVSVQPF